MNRWPESELSDKIFVKHGFPFKSEYFATEGDYIVLTPGNFWEEGGFKREKGKEKFYKGPIPEEYILKKGDLLVAMTEQAEGLLGSCAIVPEDNLYLHNQRLGLITIKDMSKVDKNYIYHLFKTRKIRIQLALTSTGSKVKHTSPERIYGLKVNLPPLNKQKKIAKFLSDLDAKIELNNKINSELEAMAKLIYDYWFVQFDFPDKNGRPYKSSGGKMVWNEELKREIPEGWEVEYIENLLLKESKTKKIQSNEYQKKGSIPIIDQSSDFICGYTDEVDSIIVTEVPRIVFGDHTRILKLINFDFARGADGTQILLSKDKRVPQHFFYHSLLKIDLSNYGYARHFKFLKQMKIIVPSFQISNKFEKKTKIIFDKVRQNKFQNQKLAELRDWLLPMLMNGQVSVGGAGEEKVQMEKVAEARGSYGE